MTWTLAVVIPSRDRAAELQGCLAELARQAPSRLAEVIVVDDGSRRPLECPQRLTADARLKLLRNHSAEGAARARNRALDHVSADAVAFLDDDARIGARWFEVLERELHPERAAITGRVLPLDSNLVARARQQRYEMRFAGLQAGQPVDFLLGGNSAMWRDAIAAVGGFPTEAAMSDSLLVDLLERAGGSCHFVPDLVIHHRHSKGLPMAVAQAWRAGSVAGRWNRKASTPLPSSTAPGQADRAARALNRGLQMAYRAGLRSSRRESVR